MGYTTPSTPEPKTVISSPEESNLAIVETAPTDPRPAKRRRVEAQRNLSVSQAINADSIIHAFCNLIIAGLLLHQPEQKVYRLDKQEQTINFQTCIVIESGNTCPKICNLESTITGPAKVPSLFQRTTTIFLGRKAKFYLVGRINVGSTFNIFRAVTGEKHECVVKMYIAEYDEDGRKIPQFDANGKEAVTCEMKRYHDIYPNLKDYVWTERLSGRHCLILPFFMDLPSTERSSSLDQISELYQAKFLSKMYEYKPECVRWCNVGRLPGAGFVQDGLVLYNLRGLREIKQGEGDARTDIMCEDEAIAAADNMEEDGCGRVDCEKLLEILKERMEYDENDTQ